MSVDSVLDGAFSLLLQKALRDELPSLPRQAGIDFFWGGGGRPLTLASVDPVVAEIPFASRLVWAHIWAGNSAGAPVAVTTTVEVRRTSLTTFGFSSPLYGTGAAPSLTAAAASNLDITNWSVNFVPGDTIIAYPTVFSGTATWIALTLQLRQTDSPQGVTTVTDNAGSDMTFNDGSTVEFRG